MKKEIVDIDKKKGIVRITTLDERWYAKPAKVPKTGLPTYNFYGSDSWISSYHPKNIGFMKWLASKGWSEAERIKAEAGNRGTKVHYACADLADGNKAGIESKYPNSEDGKEELISAREYTTVNTFYDFMKKFNPEVLAIEKTGFCEKPKHAGTIDYIMRFKKDKKHGRTEIKKGLYIVDLKTSKSIWASYELQLSAYSHLNLDLKKLKISKKEWKNRKLAFLQVGYPRNKRHWKWTGQEDKYDLFKHVYAIWQDKNSKTSPKQIKLPISVKL